MSRYTRILDKLFTKHLFATNVCLGFSFATAGDVLLQNFELRTFRKDDTYDPERSKNMFFLGVGLGTVGHGWYKFLDKRFPGNKFPSVSKKVLCEMAATPVFAGLIFGGMGALKHHSWQQIQADFRTNLPAVVAMDWLFYVPCQALNFYFLPPRYRFLFVCGITLIYDVFLSYIIHNKPGHVEPQLIKEKQ